MFHTYVYECFIMMLHMFCNGFASVLGVFANVSDACFKCFIFLQTRVAKVSSGCFKSRSGIVSPSSPSTASSRCPLLLVTLAAHPPSPSLLDAGDIHGGTDVLNSEKKLLQAQASGHPHPNKPLK